MLTKIIACIGALSLALGIATLTTVAGPVSAASADAGGPPSPAAGETCVSYGGGEIQAFASGTLSVTKGSVTVTVPAADQTGGHWSVSSSGDPLAAISVLSNGSWSDRTGLSLLNGDGGANITAAQICTAPAPAPVPVASAKETVQAPAASDPQVDPTPYVIVAWAMPRWIDQHNASFTQTFYAKADLATKDLGALDPQLTSCGTQYQVDIYNDSAITTALVQGGVLRGWSDPTEDFPLPEAAGVTYKLVHNAACLPQDAAASVAVMPPSCNAPGGATFALTNAHWEASTPADTSVGSHVRTALAVGGHLFAGGATTFDVHYTIAGVLDATGADCYKPVPVKPSFTSIDPCGVFGSITLVDSDHVHYALTTGDGKQGINVVTATAIAPYQLAPGPTAIWTVDLGTYTDCYKPSVTSTVGICQAAGGSSTKDLAVTFDNTKSTVDVTFTIPAAQITDVVKAGASDTVSIQVGTNGSPQLAVYADSTLLAHLASVPHFDGCVLATVLAQPTTSAACAVDGSLANGSINIDSKATGVAFLITGGPGSVKIVPTTTATSLPAGTYTVAVTALPGYVLDPHAAPSWPETIADPSPCATPPGCQTQLGGLSFAAVQLDSGAASTNEGCDPPTLAAWPTNATSTNASCATGIGSLTVGDVGGVSFFSEVDYFLNGQKINSPTVGLAPGSYSVTASPHTAGDGLTGDSVFPITIAPSAVLCADLKTLALSDPSLALTGSDPSGLIPLGAGLLAAGLVLVVLRLRREAGRR